MWHVKANVIPVMTGVTGTTSKSFRQNLSNILGKYKIKELQKNGHTEHHTHTLENTNVSVQNIFHMQHNITCSTICKYRTAPKLYALETWFISDI
jgi:hypothetical protein